ncbi:MotA/TolQ/ExbB proton channel family protein [Methanobrevibacter sp.]|uniref:MotA/TolQ/ExbB proton channel family protein n=1 Tax=Methanobrevibacter sp. TaxID=66852 RepID=UPI00386CC177
MVSFPGDAFISAAMDTISQSLTIPVLIILLIIVVASLFLLGEIIAEYFKNKPVKVSEIYDLIFQISNASSIEHLQIIVNQSGIPDTQKRILTKISDTHSMKKSSREAAARRLVEMEEEKIDKNLNKTDIITRIGPTLGLMGTLIPMGPGLAALGAGDINTLATSLTLAFNTTIVGIGSGALCYVLGKIRKSRYDRYLADLDALTDAVLDYMD